MTQQYNFIKVEWSKDTALLDNFFDADEVFTITPTAEGWQYARVTRRHATVILTLAVKSMLPGRTIAEILRLAGAYPDNEEELEAAMIKAGIPTHSFHAPGWMQPSVNSAAQGTALRTYLSVKDLETMLSFPFQQGSYPFERVVLASATLPAVPEAGFTRLGDRIERRYMVIYPAGVTPSSTSVVEGNKLTLTYTAPGCEPSVTHFTAGRTCPFVTYNGAAIMVQPIEALGIKLTPLKSPLEAGQRTVTLIMKFDRTREVTATATFNRDSTEYSLLRDGVFHGYRARRLAVKSKGDESYMIDLRQADNESDSIIVEQPVASTETPADTPVLPDQIATSRPDGTRRSTGSIVLIIVAVIAALALGVVALNYLPSMFKAADKYAPGLVDVSEGVSPAEAAAPAATEIETVTPEAEAIASLTADQPVEAPETEAAPEPEPAPQPEPVKKAGSGINAADLAYLNSNTVWHKDKLTGYAARELYDLICTGNLNEIASHPYFAAGECSNATAEKVVKFVWEAYQSDTQVSNTKALTKLKGSGSIDLTKLYENLARLRPRNPNQSPRP